MGKQQKKQRKEIRRLSQMINNLTMMEDEHGLLDFEEEDFLETSPVQSEGDPSSYFEEVNEEAERKDGDTDDQKTTSKATRPSTVNRQKDKSPEAKQKRFENSLMDFRTWCIKLGHGDPESLNDADESHTGEESNSEERDTLKKSKIQNYSDEKGNKPEGEKQKIKRKVGIIATNQYHVQKKAMKEQGIVPLQYENGERFTFKEWNKLPSKDKKKYQFCSWCKVNGHHFMNCPDEARVVARKGNKEDEIEQRNRSNRKPQSSSKDLDQSCKDGFPRRTCQTCSNKGHQTVNCSIKGWPRGMNEAEENVQETQRHKKRIVHKVTSTDELRRALEHHRKRKYPKDEGESETKSLEGMVVQSSEDSSEQGEISEMPDEPERRIVINYRKLDARNWEGITLQRDQLPKIKKLSKEQQQIQRAREKKEPVITGARSKESIWKKIPGRGSNEKYKKKVEMDMKRLLAEGTIKRIRTKGTHVDCYGTPDVRTVIIDASTMFTRTTFMEYYVDYSYESIRKGDYKKISIKVPEFVKHTLVIDVEGFNVKGVEAHSRFQKSALQQLIQTLRESSILHPAGKYVTFYLILGTDDVKQPGKTEEGMFGDLTEWINHQFMGYPGKVVWIGTGKKGKGTSMEIAHQQLRDHFQKRSSHTIEMNDWWLDIPQEWIRRDGSGTVAFPPTIQVERAMVKQMVQGLSDPPQWDSRACVNAKRQEKRQQRTDTWIQERKLKPTKPKRRQPKASQRKMPIPTYQRSQRDLMPKLIIPLPQGLGAISQQSGITILSKTKYGQTVFIPN